MQSICVGALRPHGDWASEPQRNAGLYFIGIESGEGNCAFMTNPQELGSKLWNYCNIAASPPSPRISRAGIDCLPQNRTMANDHIAGLDVYDPLPPSGEPCRWHYLNRPSAYFPAGNYAARCENYLRFAQCWTHGDSEFSMAPCLCVN